MRLRTPASAATTQRRKSRSRAKLTRLDTRDIVAEDLDYFVDKCVDTDSVAANAAFRVEACKELAPEYQQTGRK